MIRSPAAFRARSPLSRRASALTRAIGLVALAVCELPTLNGGIAAAAVQPLAGAERVESMCRLTGQEQGIAGKHLRAYVKSCVAQERPDLAVWESCRSRGSKQDLHGPAMAAYVTRCLHEAQ